MPKDCSACTGSCSTEDSSAKQLIVHGMSAGEAEGGGSREGGGDGGRGCCAAQGGCGAGRATAAAQERSVVAARFHAHTPGPQHHPVGSPSYLLPLLHIFPVFLSPFDDPMLITAICAFCFPPVLVLLPQIGFSAVAVLAQSFCPIFLAD